MKIKKNFVLYFLVASAFISCNKTATTIPVTQPSIGQLYQGGIVFYLDSSGKHGLMAAPVDQKTAAAWGCEGFVDSAFDTALGTGAQNTAKILNLCTTPGIAAMLCSADTVAGYAGYFLPSKDELNLMYTNIKVSGGFASSFYWCSTEDSSTYDAWFQFFGNGFQAKATKDHEFYVRAARAF